MPASGEMGCRSIDTILTSSRGVAAASSFCSPSFFSAEALCSSLMPSGRIPSICCRNCASLSCHADRPNFSPLIRTRERTCDQLPGAAHRSTTRLTLVKRSNSAHFAVSFPAPCRTEHTSLPTFVELEQLECASGSPALLFGKPVVGVTLVFG